MAAESPVIAGRPHGAHAGGDEAPVELAELLQAPVVDRAGRMNFPSRHPLNHTERARALISNADVIVALEVTDFWARFIPIVTSYIARRKPITREGAKLISISAATLRQEQLPGYPALHRSRFGDRRRCRG